MGAVVHEGHNFVLFQAGGNVGVPLKNYILYYIIADMGFDSSTMNKCMCPCCRRSHGGQVYK